MKQISIDLFPLIAEYLPEDQIWDMLTLNKTIYHELITTPLRRPMYMGCIPKLIPVKHAIFKFDVKPASIHRSFNMFNIHKDVYNYEKYIDGKRPITGRPRHANVGKTSDENCKKIINMLLSKSRNILFYKFDTKYYSETEILEFEFDCIFKDLSFIIENSFPNLKKIIYLDNDASGEISEIEKVLIKFPHIIHKNITTVDIEFVNKYQNQLEDPKINIANDNSLKYKIDGAIYFILCVSSVDTVIKKLKEISPRRLKIQLNESTKDMMSRLNELNELDVLDIKQLDSNSAKIRYMLSLNKVKILKVFWLKDTTILSCNQVDHLYLIRGLLDNIKYLTGLKTIKIHNGMTLMIPPK